MTPTANSVVKIARKQIGVYEKPAGSNCQKYGEAYGWNGTFWCAQFVWWCGWMAAKKHQSDNPIAKSASAADIQEETVAKGGKWVMEKNRSRSAREAYLKKAKPGDIVSFDFGAFDGYRDHVGLVDHVDGSYIYCIEGNTSKAGSQSNGGMVCLQKRPHTYICSAVRPAYAKVSKAAKTTYPGPYPSLTSFTGDLIARKAKELAWPYGTPKKKRVYPKGKPTKAFKEALNRTFPNRKSWNRQSAAGASCDVSMAVTVRDVGYDKSMPRGGSDQPHHFAEHKDKWKKLKVKNWKSMRPGDIICIGNHRAIYGGDGWTYEGGFGGKRYMQTIKAKNYRPGKKFYAVYRARKPMRKVFKMGDTGRQVKRLQKMLKWLGYYKGAVDGIFGEKTENAVVLFKRDNNFKKINGRFGAKSLRVAKKLKR